MSIFVDTSVWYAAIDRGDRNSSRAKEVLSVDDQLVTSDHVFVETWLLLERRINRSVADRFWDGIRQGAGAIEQVTVADLEVAWRISGEFPDQDFSVVDLTSFAVMQRLGIHQVASFDHHFAVFRYGRHRDRAFTVLR